jgi:hypothetical protein
MIECTLTIFISTHEFKKNIPERIFERLYQSIHLTLPLAAARMIPHIFLRLHSRLEKRIFYRKVLTITFEILYFYRYFLCHCSLQQFENYSKTLWSGKMHISCFHLKHFKIKSKVIRKWKKKSVLNSLKISCCRKLR